MRTALPRIFCVALVAPLLVSASPATHGARIVSINPCLDAILVAVADPGQIAGISHYSQDPRATSIPLAVARRYHTTSGTAEEVVALAPDIVLTGPHVDPATIAALKRMHVALVQYPVPATVDDSIAQVKAIAAVAGHPARGAVLAARIAAAAQPVRVPAVRALIWQGGGLVPGAGTLPDDLLKRAGFANASAGYGLKQWDVLPLEYLVARPPRMLFSTSDSGAGEDRLARHPALRRLGAHTQIVRYPSRLMNCGGPTIIAAMARLKQMRAEIAR